MSNKPKRLSELVNKKWHVELYRFVKRFYKIYDKHLIIDTDILKIRIQNGILSLYRIEMEKSQKEYCIYSTLYAIYDRKYCDFPLGLCRIDNFDLNIIESKYD